MMDLSLFLTTDEAGNEVEAQRPETKSWPDVVQCINHHKGQNDQVVARFIEMYVQNIQWNWFDDYKAWLIQCETVTQYNDALQPDDEGNQPEPMPLPVMPERPEMETVETIMRREYRLLRSAAYGDTDDQFHDVFDTEDHGINHRQAVKEQYPK